MGAIKELNEMLLLGQFQARDKEQVDELLNHLVGSYGYTYTWLISCPLVVACSIYSCFQRRYDPWQADCYQREDCPSVPFPLF